MKCNTIFKDVDIKSKDLDLKLIEKAYNFAEKAHKGQFRLSGEPYFTHCVSVARILAQYNFLDTDSICAGLLHDTIEDASYTKEQLEKEFNKEIATIVDGVTKISKLHQTSSITSPERKTKELQIENLRKIILATTKDIRVLIVKIADRLHNLLTLHFLPLEKQMLIAQDTLDIYAPLTHRLGMGKIKWKLEDLAMRYLIRDVYNELNKKITKKREEREAYINNVIKFLKEELDKLNIPAEIHGRPKHFYSIYQKMKKSGRSFEELYDLLAFRIITDSEKHCYEILGLVHSLWTPIPERFKDYIAVPKANNYQSLHTSVIAFDGEIIELQIRTDGMNRIAEEGIAAHWSYKEGKNFPSEEELKLTWLRQLIENLQDLVDSKTLLEDFKIDVHSDKVFCFTPNGDIIELPKGSTTIDFAYSIHSQVGDHCVEAKVNKRIVPLKHVLENGDVVEIVTSKSAHPSTDWLEFVKTSKAKNKIHRYLKESGFEKNLTMGQAFLAEALKSKNIKPNILHNTDIIKELLTTFNFGTLDNLVATVGYGSLSAEKVAFKIQSLVQTPESVSKPIPMPKKSGKGMSGIIIEGIGNVEMRFAKCCNPLPGDDITGFITRGRGVTIHKRNCRNLKTYLESFQDESDRFIKAEWDSSNFPQRLVEISVVANDRVGLLADISKTITSTRTSIQSSSSITKSNKKAYLTFTLQINDAFKLKDIIEKLHDIRGVIEVRKKTRVSNE